MQANAATCAQHNFKTGNDILILHEIRHALQRLLETGEETTIDLRALPMAPGEEAMIESALGVGELSIRLDALGPSTITETQFSGVWLVTHFNTEEEILGKFIEITRVPKLIIAQAEDMEHGLEQLRSKLSQSQ
ncbi:MAG: hydrogenase expression/formation C-terminal domain-containing protein [Thiolinea sp.]